MSRIHVEGGMDAQLVYSSLEDYLARLDEDRRTKYQGDPNYCAEDAAFLNDAIDRVHLLLHALKFGHPSIVTKG
jgi:hypothetical protein